MEQMTMFEQPAIERLSEETRRHFECIFQYACGDDIEVEDVMESLDAIEWFLETVGRRTIQQIEYEESRTDGDEICVNCEGSGILFCVRCGGAGWLEYEFGTKRMDCPNCNATGEHTCYRCDGTGKEA